MKYLVFFIFFISRYACSTSSKEESEELAKDDPKSDLMLNDTLCDCTALDLDREKNTIHLSGIDEPYTGWCILYRRGGKVESKRQYVNGMLNGTFLSYHPNGELDSSIPHKNNRYDGWYIKLNPEGDTIYKRFYVNGAAKNLDSLK